MTYRTKNWLSEYLTKSVDTEEVIQQTIKVFQKSTAFEKIKSYKVVPEKQFDYLHESFLTPTQLKISVNDFQKEIVEFNDYFEPWGIDSGDDRRQGLALVNQDGILKQNDPINGSLMEYNLKTGIPLLEVDCQTKTTAFDIDSLKPLQQLDKTWYRSNILKWKEGAKFVPHIDSLKPAYWIRLWATDNPDNIILRYWNDNNVHTEENIEPGRIYIIDTTLVHDAVATGDSYQFFLSVAPDQIKNLKEIL